MWSPDELSNLRFAMSEPPVPGGQAGDYEEKWSQWFPERSFFRCRAPAFLFLREFADAVQVEVSSRFTFFYFFQK
jgi:hypothetical protein